MVDATLGLNARRRVLSRAEGLVLAVSAGLCVAALAWAFHTEFPRDGFLFLYIPVIGAVAYLGGRALGFVAGGIGLLSAWYFIIPPTYSFGLTPATVPVLLVFAAVVTLMVEGAARLRAAEVAAYRSALMVASSEDGILSKSLDGIIETWNRGAERLYGYSAAEIIGRPVTVLIPPDRPDEIPDIMARLRRGEHIEHFETTRVKKDGTRIDVSVSFSPVPDAGGRIVGVSVIARDVTERRQAERALREQAELLDLTYDAVFAWHLQGAITYWNRGAEALYGFSRGEAVGRVSHDLLQTKHPEGLGDVIETLRRTGGWEGELRHVTKDGHEIIVDSRDRLIERDGRQLVLETNRDVTKRKQAEAAEASARRVAEQVAARVGRLQSLTAALSRALTPSDVADATLRHAVDGLGAGAATVSVVEGQDATPTTIGVFGYSAEVAERWWREPHRISALREAMRTAEVVWFPSWAAFKERYPAVEPSREPVLHGARAAVPLMLRGQAVGTLYMNFAEERHFGPDDLEFMLTVGRQCAQATERARLYAREHEVATTLQRALLSPTLPAVPGLRTDAVYKPATPEVNIGGDWYDAFLLPGGRLVLTVGDVEGHGLAAAVQMSEVRNAMRTAALAGFDAAKVLQAANTVLRASGRAMVTAAVVILDPVTRVCTYAVAGHPPPFMATHKGIEALEQGSIPLGFSDRLGVVAEWIELPPDALLVLYTDGLTEFDRDPIRGEAALREAVLEEYAGRSDKPAEAIMNRVTGGRPAHDDIAILIVAVEPAVNR